MNAVQDYDLSNSDFAPTDLTIEMLYLQEAKSAVTSEFRRLNSRLEWSRDAAEQEAHTDMLTGLGNRRAMERFHCELAADGLAFGLIHLDLDLFKQVNDTHGHAAGDTVLETVAQRLHKVTRKSDLVARVGGDEFVIIVDGLTDQDRLMRISTAIINQLEKPIRHEDHICRISGSIGLTVSTGGEAPDLEVMMENADLALYAAKNTGRGQAIAYTPDLRDAAQTHAAE